MADEVIGGRYRLERRLGRGGMSEVRAATDLELDRRVAVKLLAPQADPNRFRREARAAAGLAHPNVCTVYSYGELDGVPYIVLEYLPGGSLEDRLAPGAPLPDEETARIASQVAAGLAHAHARGLVHRDLKPTNILFDAAGRAKISDFGLARLDEDSGLTDAGTVLGTAAYISPEQVAGQPATKASDVYAFGVVLFRMLTGRLPFEADDALAMASMHRDRPAPAVASIRPDAPARLESLAMAALAKSPSDRPPDGGALLTELGGVLESSGADAATELLGPNRRRRRVALAGAAAGILALGGAALALALTRDDGNAGTPSTSSTVPRSTASPTPAVVQSSTAGEAETGGARLVPPTTASTTSSVPIPPVETTVAPAASLPPPSSQTATAPDATALPPPTFETASTETATTVQTAPTEVAPAATAVTGTAPDTTSTPAPPAQPG